LVVTDLGRKGKVLGIARRLGIERYLVCELGVLSASFLINIGILPTTSAPGD
jgi:hypothetical protein